MRKFSDMITNMTFWIGDQKLAFWPWPSKQNLPEILKISQNFSWSIKGSRLSPDLPPDITDWLEADLAELGKVTLPDCRDWLSCPRKNRLKNITRYSFSSPNKTMTFAAEICTLSHFFDYEIKLITLKTYWYTGNAVH